MDEERIVTYVTEEQMMEIIRDKAEECDVSVEDALKSYDPKVLVMAMFYKGFKAGVLWTTDLQRDYKLVEEGGIKDE